MDGRKDEEGGGGGGEYDSMILRNIIKAGIS